MKMIRVLGWMILIAFIQLIFRWLNFGGMDWADVHLRQLVLWLALMGGALAAARNRHIRIDIAEHWLNGNTKSIVQCAINLVAAGVSGYLAVLSSIFLIGERKAGLTIERLIFSFRAPIWIIESIIPIGFFLIALFFLGSAFIKPDVEGVE
jgi:TRAP-type C4-dicarboxylate transport system permease small subunit